MSVTVAVEKLAAEVKRARLSRPLFECVVLSLSLQQRRLFLRLARGPADTHEIREGCGLANISKAAGAINAKLQAVGDKRRIVCTLGPPRPKLGERGVLGRWRLAEPTRRAA